MRTSEFPLFLTRGRARDQRNPLMSRRTRPRGGTISLKVLQKAYYVYAKRLALIFTS